jgi:hypothetical protein
VDPVVDPVVPPAAPTLPVVTAPAPAPAPEAPAPAGVSVEVASFDSTLRGDASPLVVPAAPVAPAAEPAAIVVTPNRAAVDGDIYTRPSGFQIMVTPAAEPALKLYRGIDDQIVPMNRVLIVQVPADAFVHTVLTETVTLSATLADGSPLPAWLSFDGRSGKLIGEPPVGQSLDLAIKVSARDSQGREASTMFRIKVSDTTLQRQTSRASFSQQLARGEALTLSPGQRQWQLQGRALPLRRG